MAQVQLATKISIETHYKLNQLSNEMQKSKASIVEESIIDFFEKNRKQLSIFEEQKEQPKVIRDKNGKFRKAGK